MMLRSTFILVFVSLSLGLAGQAKEPVKQRTLREWTMSSDFTEEISSPVDTIFSLFHRFRVSDKYSPVNAYPGNYGLPFYQINFFDRIQDPDMYLYKYYYPFMHLPSNAVFMDTQVPFTELAWTFGAPRETSEQTFRVRHSQSVNRYLNFGLIYDIIYSLGQYNFQRAEDKTFILHASYTGPKYKLYFAGGINNLVSYENGGITKKDQLPLYTTREVPVNLGGVNKAVTILKNKNLLLVQRYTIGKSSETQDSSVKKKTGFLGLSGTLSHILLLESNKRTYSDSYPASGFYKSIIVNGSSTFDSLYFSIIKNTLRFDFTTDETRKFRLGGGAGIRNELFRYSQLFPLIDKPAGDIAKKARSNNVLIGKLYNNIGEKFRWAANGEMYLTGYRAGDFSLAGEMTKSFEWKKGTASWIINGKMINRQPSFWMENWGSNNFEWHNNLKKELRIDLGTSFIHPGRRTELKFNYAIISNYTDFDVNALPSQNNGALHVASALVRKELQAWKFHLNSDILVQKSTDPAILDLPLVALRSAGFFEHLFRFKSTNGKLNTQLGFDLRFHTLYHPYSYMPATGRYYRQDKVKIGNYPFVDVFLNLKLQRTRIFIMFDHVNYRRMDYEYYLIPNNPMNIRMLRYGIAWTFYN
jgi:hypothetical protein